MGLTASGLDVRVLKREWLSNVGPDILAGLLVALALIPEAIGFTIYAGLDPKIGLFASFTMSVTISIFGGRTAMISGAAGALALLFKPLVASHGFDYVIATTILTGIFQLIWSAIGLGKQLRFVSRGVMVGFVNALAILIFQAQLPELDNAKPAVYIMVAIALAIIYILPRFTTIVPSPLVAIVLLTGVAITQGLDVPTIGDKGELPTSLPSFMLPDVPLNLETLGVILPYAVMLSIVGLLESFLTANVVDDLTDSFSDKNREATGQGLANIVSGFFAGMPGCGMIGQTVINIQSGGRTRLSTLATGVFLMFLTLVMSRWVQQIPMAALVSVMIMVSIGTFNWASILKIRKLPLSETVTMLATMGATLMTHNLAIGVMVGITLSTIFFSSKIAQLVFVDKTLSEDALERTYSVAGQIFFVSVPDFIDFFDFKEDIERVTLDLTHAHLWDQSAVEAIDKIVLTFRRNGIETQLIGVNEASATLIDKLAVHDKDPSLQDLSLH